MANGKIVRQNNNSNVNGGNTCVGKTEESALPREGGRSTASRWGELENGAAMRCVASLSGKKSGVVVTGNGAGAGENGGRRQPRSLFRSSLGRKNTTRGVGLRGQNHGDGDEDVEYWEWVGNGRGGISWEPESSTLKCTMGKARRGEYNCHGDYVRAGCHVLPLTRPGPARPSAILVSLGTYLFLASSLLVYQFILRTIRKTENA